MQVNLRKLCFALIAVAIVFKSDASLLPIRGNTRMQSDYEAALRLAVVEMFEPAARSVG